MKTAMSLALARIELMKDINPDSIHWEMFKNDCIEKEKEQIMNAHTEGYSNYDSEMTSIDYFNKTYNQNK